MLAEFLVRGLALVSRMTLHGSPVARVRLGDVAPDFEAETTTGNVKFHNWLGNSWGVLFSHPADFTPVCTTELGVLEKLRPEFEKRNVHPA